MTKKCIYENKKAIPHLEWLLYTIYFLFQSLIFKLWASFFAAGIIKIDKM